jgi:hypothetical protein
VPAKEIFGEPRLREFRIAVALSSFANWQTFVAWPSHATPTNRKRSTTSTVGRCNANHPATSYIEIVGAKADLFVCRRARGPGRDVRIGTIIRQFRKHASGDRVDGGEGRVIHSAK